MFFLEAEGLVALLLFGFWIWALLDCIATDSALCRNLPKGMWIILVLILPDVGALAWLLLGRPEKAHWRPGSTDYASPRRPLGIEDEPRYSSTPAITDRRSEELDRQLAQWEEERADGGKPAGSPELEAWEIELNRREKELRQRELDLRQRELEKREREIDGE
jgi:hypothetical protein